MFVKHHSAQLKLPLSKVVHLGKVPSPYIYSAESSCSSAALSLNVSVWAELALSSRGTYSPV